MSSRSWIIPFPADYHGRDNRPWYGLVPCHDDCDEWSVVRRMTNKVWYAGCETKHPPIRLGGCKSRYEWGSHREMPTHTLTTLKSHCDAIRDMPLEYQRVLADAWGLSIEQLINGDFDHGTANEADEEHPAQTPSEEAATEISEGADAAKGPGESPGDAGASEGASPGNSDAADAGARNHEDPGDDLSTPDEPDAGGHPETGYDDSASTGPDDDLGGDEYERLMGWKD